MIALTRPQCPYPKALQDNNYKHEKNKSALRESTHGKCMYCESKIGHTDYAYVEHIKPKSKFPDLEFVWDNLGYSCGICNNSKSEKYDASQPFINPYQEDPEQYITFIDFYAFEKNGSARGKTTIQELSLNRPELLEERKETFDKILHLINEIAAEISPGVKKNASVAIRQECTNDKRYYSMMKCLLMQQNIWEDKK